MGAKKKSKQSNSSSVENYTTISNTLNEAIGYLRRNFPSGYSADDDIYRIGEYVVDQGAYQVPEPAWVGFGSRVSSNELKYKFKKIPVPPGAEKIEGFNRTAYLLRNTYPQVVSVKYAPTSISNIGFSKVYVIAKDGNVFKGMSGIWKELAKSKPFKGIITPANSVDNFPVDITNDGKVTNEFGIPNDATLVMGGFVDSVVDLYREWKDYPNEDDYKMVQKLHAARNRITRMKREDQGGSLKSTIADCQNEIAELKERISKCESELNTIYEEAADAMNFLEDRGYSVEEPPIDIKEMLDQSVTTRDEYCISRPGYYSDADLSLNEEIAPFLDAASLGRLGSGISVSSDSGGNRTWTIARN